MFSEASSPSSTAQNSPQMDIVRINKPYSLAIVLKWKLAISNQHILQRYWRILVIVRYRNPFRRVPGQKHRIRSWWTQHSQTESIQCLDARRLAILQARGDWISGLPSGNQRSIRCYLASPACSEGNKGLGGWWGYDTEQVVQGSLTVVILLSLGFNTLSREDLLSSVAALILISVPDQVWRTQVHIFLLLHCSYMILDLRI